MKHCIMMFLSSRALFKNQKGAVAALVGVSFIALCGMAALVVDVGVLYLNRTQLVNAADGAVLAGAQELPGRPIQALESLNMYANLNGKTGDVVNSALSNDNTSLSVTISRNVKLFFANIWGMQSSSVTANAAARVGTFSGGNIGIVPFGIVKQPFAFGQTYKLKLGGGDGFDGNFQALALGGTGGNIFNENLKSGYKGTFHIGDLIRTETGNMSGPTSQGVAYRIDLDPYATFDTVQNDSSRIVIAPVIESFSINGSGDVKVTGFAAFFLEGNANQGNSSYVYGKFKQMVLPGDISDFVPSYGIYGVALYN